LNIDARAHQTFFTTRLTRKLPLCYQPAEVAKM
jgi:hypothetical protein